MPTRSPYAKRGTAKIILQRLKDGSLKVDFSNGEVYSVKPPGYYRKLTQQENHRGYFFVCIHKRVRHRDGTVTDLRKCIAVHKLCWMAKHLRLVPRGFQIHHKNRDKKKNGIKNLQCISYKKHRKLHDRQDEALNYFEALAETF